MHIHHNPMTPGNIVTHSAAAAGKAAAAQRATETRRKLLKSAAHVDGTLNAGELFMVSGWSEDQRGQRERQQQHSHADAEAPEETSGVMLISVWA
jgi:hypothetical protein